MLRDPVRNRIFAGPVEVLEHGRRRLVLTQFTSERTRTFWWNPFTNETARISGLPATSRGRSCAGTSRTDRPDGQNMMVEKVAVCSNPTFS